MDKVVLKANKREVTGKQVKAMRRAGKSYEEIAAAGGGIISSVTKTREASEAQLRVRIIGVEAEVVLEPRFGKLPRDYARSYGCSCKRQARYT